VDDFLRQWTAALDPLGGDIRGVHGGVRVA
jgi:hypothetical protein